MGFSPTKLVSDRSLNKPQYTQGQSKMRQRERDFWGVENKKLLI